MYYLWPRITSKYSLLWDKIRVQRWRDEIVDWNLNLKSPTTFKTKTTGWWVSESLTDDMKWQCVPFREHSFINSSICQSCQFHRWMNGWLNELMNWRMNMYFNLFLFHHEDLRKAISAFFQFNNSSMRTLFKLFIHTTTHPLAWVESGHYESYLKRLIYALSEDRLTSRR